MSSTIEVEGLSMTLRETQCCGVKDLHGMNNGRWSARRWILGILTGDKYLYLANSTTPEKAGAAQYFMCTRHYRDKETGEDKATGADSLATARRLETLKKYVEDKGLGELIITGAQLNPNYTYNDKQTVITSALFRPNQKAMIHFAQTEYPKKCTEWRNTIPKW